MTIEDIARVTYNVNRAYCEAIGDHSFGPWDEAPEWQKDTNRAGVKFHLKNPDAPVRASHESWRDMKRAKDHLFKAVVESLRGFLDIGEG